MSSPLSSGTSDTVSINAGEGVTLDTAPGVVAIIEADSGVEGASNRKVLARHTGGRAFYGPFSPAGTVKVSAVGGSASYVVGGRQLTPDGVAGYAENSAIFYPPTDDYAGIMAARQAAIDAGGGIVQLKAITYDLTAAPAAIPLTAGVLFRGAGIEYGYRRFLEGGTVLQGGTTYNVFEYNASDAGANYATQDALYADCLYSAGVENMTISGGLNCIRMGGLYKAGGFYHKFRDLRLENPVEWCGYFENVGLSIFQDIDTSCDVSGEGHLFFAGSSAPIYNWGNNHYQNLFGEGGTALTRNFVWMARGGSGAYNDLVGVNIQSNAQGTTLTEAATMTNGSPNITIADAAAYPIDMPVTVATSQNGFSAGQSYFVVSSSGTTIQLSDQMGGTAKNATGATAVNIVRHGFPCIELVGYGNSNENVLQSANFYGIDAEGTATTCIFVQNASLILHTTFTFGAGAGNASTLCVRSSAGSFASNSGLSTDFDAGSSGGFFSMGGQIRTNNSVNSAAQGYIRDQFNNRIGLMMGTNQDGATLSLQGIGTSGRSFLYPQHSMGQRQWFRSLSTTLAMNGTSLGTGTYTGTANAIWNLPTITGTSLPTANAYVGSVLTVVNASTTGGVTLTLNTAAGQGFNRTADESVTLAVGQSIQLHACTDGTGNFWSVLGTSPGVTL